MPLTDLERDVLDWEAEHVHFKHGGSRERLVLERFGWSLTKHALVLHSLLDRPEAAAYDAQLVHRLRRLRDARARQRSASLGWE